MAKKNKIPKELIEYFDEKVSSMNTMALQLVAPKNEENTKEIVGSVQEGNDYLDKIFGVLSSDFKLSKDAARDKALDPDAPNEDPSIVPTDINKSFFDEFGDKILNASKSQWDSQKGILDKSLGFLGAAGAEMTGSILAKHIPKEFWMKAGNMAFAGLKTSAGIAVIAVAATAAYKGMSDMLEADKEEAITAKTLDEVVSKAYGKDVERILKETSHNQFDFKRTLKDFGAQVMDVTAPDWIFGKDMAWLGATASKSRGSEIEYAKEKATDIILGKDIEVDISTNIGKLIDVFSKDLTFISEVGRSITKKPFQIINDMNIQNDNIIQVIPSIDKSSDKDISINPIDNSVLTKKPALNEDLFDNLTSYFSKDHLVDKEVVSPTNRDIGGDITDPNKIYRVAESNDEYIHKGKVHNPRIPAQKNQLESLLLDKLQVDLSGIDNSNLESIMLDNNQMMKLFLQTMVALAKNQKSGNLINNFQSFGSQQRSGSMGAPKNKFA